jgi:hypothetical protein
MITARVLRLFLATSVATEAPSMDTFEVFSLGRKLARRGLEHGANAGVAENCLPYFCAVFIFSFEGFANFLVKFERIGGRDRVRTCDPLLAKQVLSQLSYTPILIVL